MKSIAFHNLGCKVNAYEMEVMQQIIQKRNYIIVEFTQKADIYVVNTCTVTNIADRKSRQMLHRAKQLNPDAVVVAVGCYAQTGLEDLKKDLSVDIIIGNNHKTEIADILDKYFEEKDACQNLCEKNCPDKADKVNAAKPADSAAADSDHMIVMSDLSMFAEYEKAENTESADYTRADVKIQDGCNQFCAYCAIPLARGRVRSRRPEEIIEEIKKLCANGHKEIILTGIHISSYGIDFDDESWKNGICSPSEHANSKNGEMMHDYRGQSKLFDLIEMIDRSVPENILSRIRIGSLEPRIITEENVTRLVNVSRVCAHFHLSLQSGCDSVLKRMNRHYNTEEYLTGVRLLRKLYGKAGRRVAITTDVIVGFPGETAEEFDTTRKYLEDICLYEMHIFKYSRRKNTVADKMPGQITGTVKDERSDILLNMTGRQSANYRKALIGKNTEVLVEEIKNNMAVGHTEDYVSVAVPCDENGITADGKKIIPGKIIEVRAEKLLDEETILGVIC